MDNQNLIAYHQILDSPSANSLFRYRNGSRMLKFLLFLTSIYVSMNAAYHERRMWTKVRWSAWWERIVLESWDDDDFKENFRVSRRTFHHICEQLTPMIRKKFMIRRPISVKRRVAVTLVKLGSSGELRTVANLFGIARCTACIIIKEVCTALCMIFKIKFPRNSDLHEIATEFFNRPALPGCCGALDWCHIPIKAPSQNAKDYFCRKQFHSLILQAVVEGNCRFINVNVGWPGSVHDARVFRNSQLYLAGVTSKLFSPANVTVYDNSYKPFLVADSAYPLLPWVMKPFGRSLTHEMANFNKKLSCGRVVVEHAFGQLKGRWRCLLKANDSQTGNVKTQVLACCVLHNICKDFTDEFIDRWDVEDSTNGDDELAHNDSNLEEGKKMRNYLLEKFCM
ncbi:protein ALP1-like [Trichonephila clavata]|uniref:Protein ALP1-like n=1 Tax=Trichonephila clavata TaxID=2740835 RepID=A0A8X6LLM0_TRICU|nr:protein ALP1-like [Trichonephila clavata]